LPVAWAAASVGVVFTLPLSRLPAFKEPT
jgi:hypothetical protein